MLYVRNLMLSTTEVQIEETFSAHAAVERVKKIRDYAFVHFHTKEDAHSTMEAMNGEVKNTVVVMDCYLFFNDHVLTTVSAYPGHQCIYSSRHVHLFLQAVI